MNTADSIGDEMDDFDESRDEDFGHGHHQSLEEEYSDPVDEEMYMREIFGYPY